MLLNQVKPFLFVYQISTNFMFLVKIKIHLGNIPDSQMMTEQWTIIVMSFSCYVYLKHIKQYLF